MLDEIEMDKIFERKCDNTIQTCTQSNENRQEIYLQHYDHTYSKKNDIIDFVNDDCLKEIFMYMSVCERPKIAQVCKNWNRVFYSYCFSRVKKLVLSHWEYDCPQNSLMKFKTSGKKFYFLRSFFDKFCICLMELDLVAYDNSNIVPILNESCPNLVKLRLRLKYPFDDQDLENAFSRMSKLRVLKIIFQRTHKIPRALIFSLENVASTLNELTLISQNEGILTLCQFPSSFLFIIPKLKALKTIVISGMWITSSIREAIHDAKLKFHHHANIYHYHKLVKIMNGELINITKLCLDEEYKITDDILYNLANSLKFLSCLSANCSLVTDVGIQAITKMKHLKRLHLYGENHITDSSLKLLKGLEKLELQDCNKITNKSVEKILENSPFMEELWFRHTSVTPEFLLTAEMMAKKRKKFLKVYAHFSRCVGLFQRKFFYVHCLCCVDL